NRSTRPHPAPNRPSPPPPSLAGWECEQAATSGGAWALSAGRRARQVRRGEAGSIGRSDGEKLPRVEAPCLEARASGRAVQRLQERARDGDRILGTVDGAPHHQEVRSGRPGLGGSPCPRLVP